MIILGVFFRELAKRKIPLGTLVKREKSPSGNFWKYCKSIAENRIVDLHKKQAKVK